MVGEKLVERVGGGDQESERGFAAARGTSGLLPGPGNTPRVPSQQGCAHSTYVDPQLQRAVEVLTTAAALPRWEQADQVLLTLAEAQCAARTSP